MYSGSIKNLGVNKIERETKIGLDKFRGDLERICAGAESVINKSPSTYVAEQVRF